MSDQKTSGSSPAAISMDNAAARQKIEAEYHSKKPVWPRYYKEICEKCDREAKEQQFCTSESERHQNRGLNRYRDVNPYDHSRIILKRGSVDYINANLVKMERAARQYILTQGPLEDTVGHFWLMVWEQASSAILMLNKLMEKKQIKCHLYWPNELGADKALKLPHVKLTVELVRCETYQNFVRRWFKLTDLETHQSREVLQFHYTTWPDFGIPGSPDAFLKFLQQVRDSGCLSRDVGPAVVHCSAGIGRSGTFCLVDCCLVLIDQYGECNVSKVLCELRSYRMGLIQTADQLDFSYQAIIEGIQKLHDPTFLDAEEPTISNDTDTNHHTLDELPPPLPRRVASLILPLAPNSGGVLSLDMRAAQANGAAGATGELIIGELSSKDALNNIINHPHDIIRDAEVADRLRPLPPLPSVRDANDTDSDDGDDDDDDDYSLEDIEDDDEDEEEEYETINDEDHDAEPVNGPSKVPIPTTTTQAADDVNANNEKPAPVSGEEISSKANGIDTIPGQQLPASPENELKRRKRNEYQASLEQKVNDIKRKQREGEDSQVAAKKRRSLLTYIAAGVVVGVICAYAYTKLG